MDVMELLTSTLIQGLIYALISYGVYITYSMSNQTSFKT